MSRNARCLLTKVRGTVRDAGQGDFHGDANPPWPNHRGDGIILARKIVSRLAAGLGCIPPKPVPCTLQLEASEQISADFDPTPGQIGFVSVDNKLQLVVDTVANPDDANRANLMIDVITGLTRMDSMANLESDRILSAIAFSDNQPDATSTTMFAIDFTSDSLLTMNPVTGEASVIGALNVPGVDFLSGSLEIVTIDNENRGFAMLQVDNGDMIGSRMYWIDLASGQAMELLSQFFLEDLWTLTALQFENIHDLALAPAALAH